MPYAKLEFPTTEARWLRAFTDRFPEAELRVFNSARADGTTTLFAELSAPDVSAARSAIRGYDAVVEAERLGEGDDGAFVRLESTEPILQEPIGPAWPDVDAPFTVRDGTVVCCVAVTGDRLPALRERLRGCAASIGAVYRGFEPERLLTDQQRTLLRVAADRGYYDTPRDCTQEEIATAAGIAKSTCSETLHRAEGRIVEQFLTDCDGGCACPAPIDELV